MNQPVEFALALSNSFPTGTGSFGYTGSFNVVVQNVAPAKQVAIRAQVGSVWQDIPATRVQSLPGNLELWTAPASNSEGQFAAWCAVNGTTYWDNNGWMNYQFPKAFDDFAALAGADYPVVLGSAGLAAATLTVDVGVQDLAYDKVVGIVFTADNWATAQTAFAHYDHTMTSGLQAWRVTAPAGGAAEVKFAIFYRVAGNEYWDNNFWRNYRVTPTKAAKWGDAP